MMLHNGLVILLGYVLVLTDHELETKQSFTVLERITSRSQSEQNIPFGITRSYFLLDQCTGRDKVFDMITIFY